MTRQSIAIDMDEVLADTVGALIKRVNERTDLGISYDMLDGKITSCYARTRWFIDRNFTRTRIFGQLEVMAQAQEVVKKLTAYYDVYIATAAMDVPTSFHDKYEWLRVLSIFRSTTFCVLW